MKEIDVFYNTYNARHLNPQEVAESFIWSENFSKLIQNNHSVILGARGCGKTTLMKMLTLPALSSWRNEQADKIRKDINFFSIYVSTDIYWDVKNQIYSSQLMKFGDFSQVISEFSVNTNVFKSLCQTFKDIVSIELLEPDDKKEVEFCQFLIEAWKLKNTIPQFDYVIDALNLRIDTVNQKIQGLIFNYRSEEDLPKDDFFNLSFDSSLEYVIPIFQRIYGLTDHKKWALCFDELEFAPIWLQRKLFGSLRSRTQFILYKLSASPILSKDIESLILQDYGPTPGNDYQIIKMWELAKNEEFSRLLIESVLKKRFPNAVPEKYFGTNGIYNKKSDSYKEGSEFYMQLLQLIEKDKSFESFLVENSVNTKNPVPSNDSQKDTLFRKIKPIVYFRNFYLKNKGEVEPAVKARSRKTSELYFGIEVLKKVCDGNPRWLIGLITSILTKSDENGADIRVQFDELLSTSKRFCNVIENIPIGKNSKQNFKQVLEKIGNYFKDQVLGPTFYMDPKGTFKVDLNNSAESNNIVEILEKGVSQGAFILLDSLDDSFDFQIRGKRFKLSYLLSIQYKLPLRKYPDASLKDILKKNKHVSSWDDLDVQLQIFN